MSTTTFDDRSPLEQAIEEFQRAEDALRQFEVSVSELHSAHDIVIDAGTQLQAVARTVMDGAGALRETSESLRTTSEQLRQNMITIGRFQPETLEALVRELCDRTEELITRVAATEAAHKSTEATITQHSVTITGLAGQVAGVIERSSDLRVALDALAQANRDQSEGIDQLRLSVDATGRRVTWTMVAALVASVLSAVTVALAVVSGS